MTVPPLLSVDLGNTRCKLRLWARTPSGPAPLRAGDFDSASASLPAIEAWLDELPPDTLVALACVGPRELERALRARIDARLGAGAARTPDPGLELAVREAHTVGLDRLFAARAAAERVGASALVLDAGTALTVDALEVRADGARVFRGGAIAAGPELALAALARGAARLPEVAPRPGARALGGDTPEALEAGAVIGFRGAALELVRRIGEESGLGRVPLVLSGGARAFLLEPALFEGREVLVVEDLVHLGLVAARLDGGAA